MTPRNQKIEELTSLLQQVAHAHHQAFIESDGDDPEWPLWYAEYLQKNLNQLLGSRFTVSELVYHLQEVTNRHEAQANGKSWAEFTAIYFFDIAGSKGSR